MVTLKEIIEKFETEEGGEGAGSLTIPKKERGVSFFEALTPAFIGGIVIGIFAGIPLLNIILPLFCVGGYLAVKLVDEFYEIKINEKEATKIGTFAGFIGAFISGLIILIVAALFSENFFSFFGRVFGYDVGNFILLLSGFDVYVSLETLRMRFIANFIFCILFGSIGGWIYPKINLNS